MTQARTNDPLTTLVQDLRSLAGQGARVGFGPLVDTLGARGLGPVLMVLAALLMLPTGMIPGMPASVGVIEILLGLLGIVGGRLKVPGRLARVTLSAHHIAGLADRIAPIARRLARVIRPRFGVLVRGPLALAALGGILIPTGAGLILLGFIPLMPFILSLHVLLIGLGLASRDGLVVLAGYALLMPEAALIAWLWP